MAEDDQRHVFVIHEIEKFLRACPQLLLVVVELPSRPIGSEELLLGDGVDRQKHGSSLW